KQKRTNLDVNSRQAVIAELLRVSDKGTVKKGAFTKVAAQFNTNRHTIASLWKHYHLQKAAGVVSPDLRNRRFGTAGPKGVDLGAFREKIAQVPLTNRTSL
ncbi:unnamed protein product, partial [Laminaria digitata]